MPILILEPNPKFKLGHVVATQGIEALDLSEKQIGSMLSQHVGGNWGAVCDEDKETNNYALANDMRILSAYPIDPLQPCKGYGENCIWIITEADRSTTTILLPEEY